MRTADLCTHVTLVISIPSVVAVLGAKVVDIGSSNIANIGTDY